MEKPAAVEYPVHELIRRRWSPRAFAKKRVEAEVLCSLLEAGRWAASCFNEQPWRYILATQDQPEEFGRMLACLVEKNQRWAKAAPVLIISAMKKTFTQNAKPNRTAQHDVGAASAQLTFEATARGLVVHQMAGIDLQTIRETYSIPDDFEPVAGLAVGYPGEPDQLSDEFRGPEIAPRTRRPLSQFVFSKLWDVSAEFVTPAPKD